MEWTTGLEYWNGLLDWHIFGFYTLLVGLIDSHWLQVPSGDLQPSRNGEISSKPSFINLFYAIYTLTLVYETMLI